jgi:hypothetical protein
LREESTLEYSRNGAGPYECHMACKELGSLEVTINGFPLRGILVSSGKDSETVFITEEPNPHTVREFEDFANRIKEGSTLPFYTLAAMPGELVSIVRWDRLE